MQKMSEYNFLFYLKCSYLKSITIRTIVTPSRLQQHYIIHRPLQATNTATMNQLLLHR